MAKQLVILMLLDARLTEQLEIAKEAAMSWADWGTTVAGNTTRI